MKMLKENNGDWSSMRFALVIIVGMACLIVSLTGGALLVQASKGVDINWTGYATVIGAIGAFIAPAFGFKAVQKKYEEKR
jgi:hypothetical protein